MRQLEVCCGGYADAIRAWKAGAKRIELCSSLFLGGITPSVGALTLIKKKTDLEVICIVRPRGAGFIYDDLEFEQMMHAAQCLLEAGADGISFGFLDEDFSLDNTRIQQMTILIHSYGKEAIFHRAFDVLRNPLHNAKLLISHGVDGILTSGCFGFACTLICILYISFYAKDITIFRAASDIGSFPHNTSFGRFPHVIILAYHYG